MNHTNETNAAIDKLQRIEQSWKELAHTRLNTPEYQTLMNKIRVMTAEYQALVDASETPEKSK